MYKISNKEPHEYVYQRSKLQKMIYCYFWQQIYGASTKNQNWFKIKMLFCSSRFKILRFCDFLFSKYDDQNTKAESEIKREINLSDDLSSPSAMP